MKPEKECKFFHAKCCVVEKESDLGELWQGAVSGGQKS